MNIAELFVNLGIKGSEKTLGALSSMKKGMSEITSTSLETKAALLAALYGFERLMAQSGAMGTSLTNFTALTGLSSQALQQWQFAARQAGVSGEEMTGSLKGVQNAMTNMLLGKGAPQGLGLVNSLVGFDPAKARDTFYVMEQLQKFAQKAPADVGNSVLKSFGLSEGVIAAMRRNEFRPDMLRRAPTYSENEIRALDRANIAWSNLANKIQMAFGHFNAMHGGELVKDISKITDQIIKLTDSLITLADKLKVFGWITKMFEGWNRLVGAGTTVVDAIGDPKKMDALKKNLDDFNMESPNALRLMFQDLFSSEGRKRLLDSSGIAPLLPGSSTPTKTQQNVNINQNLHFQHDGKDAVKIHDSVKKANQHALRQMAAQGQAS